MPANYDLSEETLIASCQAQAAVDDLEKDKLKGNEDKPLDDIEEKSSILTQLKNEICSLQYISLGVWYWIGSGSFVQKMDRPLLFNDRLLWYSRVIIYNL